MTGWAWLLVFLAIGILGGWWLWHRARGTWRAVRALNAQLAQSALLVDQVGGAQPAGAPQPEPTLAVFTDPHDAYRQRTDVRASVQAERRARREANLPPWARRRMPPQS